MLNWKFVNKIILYNGTFDGLLSIVFDLWVRREIPFQIVPESEYVFNFLNQTEINQISKIKAKKVYDGIVEKIGYDALVFSYYAFLSGNTNNVCENKEIEIVKYLLCGFQTGPKINNMLSVDYVWKVHRLKKNVLKEVHKLKGLVRFQELDNGLFYSSIHPDNNVIESLGNFFIKRFPKQNFMLHDQKRGIAFLYNTKEYAIIEAPIGSIAPCLSKSEKEFQKLWKLFFETIAIQERTNKKLQMQHMPKKYWKNLVEI